MDDWTKLVPVTVSVMPAAPTPMLLGETPVTVGAGFWTRRVAAEVPPPGAGVTTVTVAAPAVMRSLAGIAAVSVVELPNVVARFVPFHCTTDERDEIGAAEREGEAGAADGGGARREAGHASALGSRSARW